MNVIKKNDELLRFNCPAVGVSMQSSTAATG